MKVKGEIFLTYCFFEQITVACSTRSCPPLSPNPVSAPERVNMSIHKLQKLYEYSNIYSQQHHHHLEDKACGVWN